MPSEQRNLEREIDSLSALSEYMENETSVEGVVRAACRVYDCIDRCRDLVAAEVIQVAEPTTNHE